MSPQTKDLSQLLKLKYQYWSSQRVTVQNRLKVFIWLGLFFIASYFFTNRVHIFEPTVLPLTAVDKFFPFWDWTVWIYISDYIYPLVIGWQLTSSLELTRLSFAFFLMTFFTNITFLLIPINYPRELYPLTENSNLVLEWIRIVDTAANCFPSAHVSIVWLSMLAAYKIKPKWFWIYFVWAILICLSTLTTKQHYFVDVLAGILLGHFCYRTSIRIVQ